MQRLREFINPNFVSQGVAPDGFAVVVGIQPNSTGDTYHWVSTPRAPDPVSVDGELVDGLPVGDWPVHMMFDSTSSASLVVESVSLVRDSGRDVMLVGGSHLGTDVYHLFDVSAGAGSPVRVRFDMASMLVSGPGFPEPRLICYGSSIPNQQLRDAIDLAFGATGVQGDTVPVGVDISAGLPLQNVFNLVQAIQRPGLQFELTIATTPAPTCPL